MQSKFSKHFSDNNFNYKISISSKPRTWQIKLKQKSKIFKGFSKPPFQITSSTDGSANEDHVVWKNLLGLFKQNPKVFLKQTNKMQTQGRNARVGSVDASNWIKNDRNNAVGLILDDLQIPLICLDIDTGFVGQRIIDLAKGQLTDQLQFSEIFEKCILVATETPGHVHLYYKCPHSLPAKFKEQNRRFSLLSRLGFPIEYHFKLVTFASLKRQLIYAPPSIEEVGYLPKLLFPYNGPLAKAGSFESNLTGSSKLGKNRPEPSFIPKGKRHTTLFEWTNRDNHSVSEIKAMFYLTCDHLEDTLYFEKYANASFKSSSKKDPTNVINSRRKYWHLFLDYDFHGQIPREFPSGHSRPLSGNETESKPTLQATQFDLVHQNPAPQPVDLNALFSQHLIEEPTTTLQSTKSEVLQAEKVSTVKNLEKNLLHQLSLRLRPEDPHVELSYRQLKDLKLIPSPSQSTILSTLGFNPDRVYRSIVEYQTPLDVILFVAGVESRFDLFLEDRAWLGRHLEFVVLKFLKDRDLLKIIYLSEHTKKQWYLFDGLSWVPSTAKQILDHLYRILLDFHFGGLERGLNDVQALKALTVLTEKQKWPPQLRGITFKNGTLMIDNQKNPVLIPHNPDHFIKDKWRFDYDPHAWLTPADCKIMQDVCGGKTRLYHILRLMIFLIFVQGHHQLGFFLHGSAGGSKTTLMNYLKELDFKNQSTIDPRTLSVNKFHTGDLVAGKSLLLVPDVSPESLGKATVDFLKNLLGRDSLVGEKKFEEAWNFVSDAVLVIVSNYAPSKIPAFKDPAVMQRIVNFPTPAIANEFRVSNLERLLLQNPSGMINWALNIPEELAFNNLRATSLNEEISPLFSLLDNFIESCVLKCPNNFASNLDLSKAYVKFIETVKPVTPKAQVSEKAKDEKEKPETEDLDFSDILTNESRKRVFISRFKARLYRFKDHNIKEARKGKNRDRGFENLKLVSKDDVLDSQLRMIKESRLSSILDASPFQYKGVILSDPKTGRFVQSNPSNKPLQSYGEKTAYLVYRFPFKVLLGLKTPDSYANSHLLLDQETSGQSLDETLQWDLSAKQSWRKDIDPTLALPEKSLENLRILTRTFPEEPLKASLPQPEQPIQPQQTETLSSEETKIEKSELPVSIDDFHDKNQNNIPALQSNVEEAHHDGKTKVEKGSERNREKGLQENPSKSGKPKPKFMVPQPKDSKSKATSRGRKKGDYDKDVKPLEERPEYLAGALRLPEDWFNMDEYQLFDLCYQKALNNSKENLVRPLRRAFNSAKLKFKVNSKIIKSCLQRDSLSSYHTFQQPYLSAFSIRSAMDEFRFFPQLSALEFICLINQNFRPALIKAFDQVRFLKNPSPYNFFGRSLPGSVDLIKPKSLFFELNKEKFGERMAQQLNDQFDGGSLFPLGYEFGDKSYGRFLSVPRSTCSTLKHQVKSIVLENISKKSALNFVELDLKSCHTVIYKTLAQRAGYDLDAEIPDPQTLWPTLTKAFLKAREIVKFSSPTFENIVLNWTENQIKIILKAQWYKGLNAGNVFKSFDILNNARNSLGIPNKDQVAADLYLERDSNGDFDIKGLSQEVEKINKEIVYFADLYKFNDIINANQEIFLPTQMEGFLTTTLSKKQEEDLRRKKVNSNRDFGDYSSQMMGKTGMSRIFSTCEVVLVMMVYLVLENFQDVIPLSYEADGLLIVGYVKDPEDLLSKINDCFSELSSRFIEGNYVLEFKQIYGY